MNKHYISADELLNDAFKLAQQIRQANFTPSFIIGVWRGGTPIAAAVHEYFAFNGVHADHFAIRASSYNGVDQQRQVQLYGLDYVFENIDANSRILLVDDVFDSGNSMAAISQVIYQHLPSLAKSQLKIATPWFKPQRNQTQLQPDFYLHTTEKWLVFPHELYGLSRAELIANKPFLDDIEQYI